MRLLLCVGLIAAACGPAQVAAPAATTPTQAAASPAASPTAPVPAGGVRFTATPFKGLATVRVEEHLAVNLIDTDAVLTSNGVDGVLTLNADGTFAPDSKLVVDMTRLQSDQSLRDKWIELFGVQTGKFKISTFVPQRATGLPSPLPANGQWTFTLDGMLTVHGVTKPVTWKATATRTGRDLAGTATGLVHWADFDIEKPQAAVTQVVSVTDDIRLELKFVGTQAD
ncbi:MAG TPA: YceI family protein [Mycobacteriales bacterium]|nr:YceI family protein [Mycobacteriales bacterium]